MAQIERGTGRITVLVSDGCNQLDQIGRSEAGSLIRPLVGGMHQRPLLIQGYRARGAVDRHHKGHCAPWAADLADDIRTVFIKQDALVRCRVHQAAVSACCADIQAVDQATRTISAIGTGKGTRKVGRSIVRQECFIHRQRAGGRLVSDDCRDVILNLHQELSGQSNRIAGFTGQQNAGEVHDHKLIVITVGIGVIQ